MHTGLVKSLLKQEPNKTMEEKKTEEKKSHREVTEFRIQACTDAPSSVFTSSVVDRAA